MKLSLLAFVATHFFVVFDARAEEIPLSRSSHPRGFIEGGALPPIVRAHAPIGMSGSGERAPAANSVNPPAAQITQGSAAAGVNIIGNTRIDARVQGATATAVGEKNTSANRLGAIGGK